MSNTNIEMPFNQRLVAVFVLLIFTINQLPGQTVNFFEKQGAERLEYYLDKASEEKAEEKWEQLALDGMVVALAVWESNAKSKAEEESCERVKAEYENKVKEKYIEWQTKKYLEENYALQSSEIIQKLSKAAKVWKYKTEDGSETDTITESQAAEAKAQWEEYASNLVNSYVITANFSAEKINGLDKSFSGLTPEEISNIIEKTRAKYEKSLESECEDIIKAEGNDLMRYLLYDQYSMRKVTDKEAAGVIAKSLANEASTETTNNLNWVFSQIDTYIKEYGEEKIDTAQEEWLSKFSLVMEESLNKWDEAEKAFLVKRVEWEKSASEIYAEDEEVWQEAYNILLAKQKAWKKELIKKIQAGAEKWKDQKTLITEELQAVMSEYVANLENEKSTKEKIIEVHVSSYNTAREILAMSSDGIEGWFKKWTEKYKGLYSYWKSEDTGSKKNDLEEENGKKTSYNSTDNLNKLKAFQEEQGSHITEFEQTSYIITEADVETLVSYINAWKESYRQAVFRELQKAYLYKQKRINTIKDNISSYKTSNEDEEYDEESIDISELSELIELEEKLKRENTDLELIKSQINEIKDIKIVKYTSYEELKDFSDTKIEAEKTAFKNALNKIESESGILSTKSDENFKEESIILNSGLFATDNLIYASEGTLYTWLYDHVKYVNTCKSEIKKIFKETGSTAAVEINKGEGGTKTKVSYDELTLEYLKAEALKEYWAEQKEILEESVEYIKNKTSTSAPLEETERALQEAMAAYKAASKAYEDETKILQTKAEAVAAGKTEVESKKEEIAKKFEELKEARTEYNSVLAIYNGVSNDSLRTKIEDIINRINGIENNSERKEEYLKEYYNTYQHYLAIKLEADKKIVLKSLTEGNEKEGLVSKEKLEERVEADDLINAENINELNNMLTKVSSYNQMEVMYIREGFINLGGEKEQQLYKELIRKAAENINLSNEEEKQRRIYAEKYINTGKCAEEGGSTQNKEEIDSVSLRKKALLKAAKNIAMFAIQNKVSTEDSEKLTALMEEINKLLEEKNEELEEAIEKSDNGQIKDIMCGRNIFRETYLNIFMTYEYTNQMWTDEECKKVRLSEIAKSVEKDYKSYNSKVLQESNDKARAEVAKVINKKGSEKNIEEYVTELYTAGQNLNSAGAQAMENYIFEYIRQYIIENKIIAGQNEDSLKNQISEDTKELCAIQEELGELSSWRSVSGFTGVLDIMTSSLYQAKKDEELTKALTDYATNLLYQEMVISDVITYDKGVTEETVKDYLANYRKTEKYNAVTEDFYSSVAKKIVDFYNKTYRDFDKEQKEIFNYLSNEKKEDNESIEKYEKAQKLTKDLKSIRKKWEENKEEKYICFLFEEGNTAFNKLLAQLSEAQQKAYNSLNAADKKEILTDYRTKLSEKSTSDYTKENLIDSFNEVLGKYLKDIKDEKGNQVYAGLPLDAAIYSQDEVETYAKAKTNEEWNESVKESCFESYDYENIDNSWYNASLAGSDFLYVYLSMHDEDVELIEEVLEYVKKHGMEDKNAKSNISKLQQYSTIKKLINNYSPYFDGDADKWLEESGYTKESEIYKAVYDSLVYGIEYHTESHYEADKKSLTKTTGSTEYGGDINLTSGKFIKSKRESFASLDKKITALEDREYKEYCKARFNYMYDNIILTNINEDLSYQETIIKKVNTNNAKNGVEGTFEITKVKEAEDCREAYGNYFTKYDDGSWQKYTNYVSEKLDTVQKLLMAAQTKIIAAETDRQNLLTELKNQFGTLEANQNSMGEQLGNLRSKRKVYEEAEKAYNDSVENFKEATENYRIKVESYNTELTQVNEKYNILEKARLEYRKANEIYEWAENTYLRTETGKTEVKESSQFDLTVYKSPEERLETVKTSYTAASLSSEVLQNLIQRNTDLIEEEKVSYQKELTAYEKAEKNYYMTRVLTAEVTSAIDSQRKVLNNKMTEESKAIAKILNTTFYEENQAKNPYRLPEGISSLVKATVSKDENGKTKYSFSLRKNLEIKTDINTDEQGIETIKKTVCVTYTEGSSDADKEKNAEILDKYLNEEIGQTKLDAYDKEYKERLSQKEAEAWLKEMNNNQEYFDKIILAAIYLQANVAEKEGNEREFGEYKNLTKDNVYELSGIKKMHNVDYFAAMKRKGKEFLEECYKEVTEEEIAKYLLYKDTYLDYSLNLIGRAEKALRIKAMEGTVNYAGNKKTDFLVVGGVNTAAAAGYYAIAALPFGIGAWALIPAATHTVLAGCEFSKARDTQDAMEKISDLKNGEQTLLTKYTDYMTKSVADWKVKTTEVDTERKELNKMLYGTETTPVKNDTNAKAMSYETFIVAIEKSLEGNRNISAEDIKTIVTEKNFEIVSGKGTSLDEVLSNIVTYYQKTVQEKKSVLQTAVFGTDQKDEYGNKKITGGIAGEQQEKAEAYYEYLEKCLSGEIVVTGNKEKDSPIKNKLMELATAAWGSGTYRGNEYYSKLVGIYSSLDKEKVSYNRKTEEYIYEEETDYDTEVLKTGVINSYIASYMEALNAEKQLKISQKEYELGLIMQDLVDQESRWLTQISYISAVADKEWEKAAQRINNDYNTWQANFDEAYDKAITEWNANYKEFQESRQQWTIAQYMNASLKKWEETVESAKEVQNEIISRIMEKSGLTGKINDNMESLKADSERYISSITNTALLNRITEYGNSLIDSSERGVKRAKTGNEISRDAEKWLDEAQAKSMALQKEYNKVAAKLSQQQMEEQLKVSIDSFMARIELQNKEMRDWEENLVLSDGYTVNGRQIARETIVDSTLSKNVKKKQTVRMYEDFKIARPEIRVDSVDGQKGEDVMEKILLAAENAKQWAIKVFGQTKYENADGKVVSSTVSRKISKADRINTGNLIAEELVESYKETAEKYKESQNKNLSDSKELETLEGKIKDKGYNI